MNKTAIAESNNESNLQSAQQLIAALRWIKGEATILAGLVDEHGSAFAIAEGIAARAERELMEII